MYTVCVRVCNVCVPHNCVPPANCSLTPQLQCVCCCALGGCFLQKEDLLPIQHAPTAPETRRNES